MVNGDTPHDDTPSAGVSNEGAPSGDAHGGDALGGDAHGGDAPDGDGANEGAPGGDAPGGDGASDDRTSDDQASDALIAALAAGLRPVRRVASPGAATGMWTLAAVGILAASSGLFRVRPDFMPWLLSGEDAPELILAAATAVSAAFAVFQSAIPGRDRRWMLPPVIAGLGWIGVLGVGCWNDFALSGTLSLQKETSLSCLLFIAVFGTPILLLTLWMARHAVVRRPWPVTWLAGLAASAAADVGLGLVDHPHAALTTLIWHGGAAVAVMGLAAVLGPWWMRRGIRWSGMGTGPVFGRSR